MSTTLWTGRGLWPATVGLMVSCIVAPVTALLSPLLPGWQGWFLAAFCGVSAMEACYSYHLYRREQSKLWAHLRCQALEVAGLCITRQFGIALITGHAPLQAGVPRFDLAAAAVFGLSSALVFLSWLAALV